MAADLLAHFPSAFTPRPAQQHVLRQIADALDHAGDEPQVFFVEAPPGVGKSHIAMTIARWSGNAYLLTSQKLLQEQYEREFGDDVQLVKGRDNYLCERYPGSLVTTSHGMCRRRGGPPCHCAYARAKATAMKGPIFCTNTTYFLTLRQWQPEHVDRRRALVIDEAHNLEAQLVGVFTVAFSPDQMRAWFGGPLPRLAAAEAYRDLIGDHVARLETDLAAVDRELEALSATTPELDFLSVPPSREERDLLSKRDTLAQALTRTGIFLGGADTEWIVRYPDRHEASLELVPISVAPMARELLFDAADVVVLSSAYLGHHAALAECFGLPRDAVHTVQSASPFPLERRPIVYQPVGALSQRTLAELEPLVFHEVAAILARHARDKGLVHVASYAAGERLVRHLAAHAPAEHRRVIWIESALAKSDALDLHRASHLPTVLLSPSLREGVDLPDEYLRFQILTKMPFPDLGDPWTAARLARDPRWYAIETAKALVQAYGRSCRHAEDHGITYVLDGQFTRFLTRYRPLLPPWFLDAAHAAIRDWKSSGGM